MRLPRVVPARSIERGFDHSPLKNPGIGGCTADGFCKWARPSHGGAGGSSIFVFASAVRFGYGSLRMEWRDYITADPAVLVGKPVIKGSRLAVEFILELIAEGWSEADMLRNYPGLTREQILACVGYARERLSEEKVFAVPA
jgi:uncharacterized protein (DUF433 family)